MATDILQTILARKAVEVRERSASLPLVELSARCADLPPTRGFAKALHAKIAAGKPAVIAEIKKASPSKGVIRPDFNPAAIAASYERGGAACLSVLTDVDFFQGADDYLRQARAACALPVLRKDFIIDCYQVYEARAAGADAILLIAECLHESEIIDFQILATELQMTTILEVHQLESLWRVINHVGFPHPGYGLLGINNRDLETMKTDIRHAMRIADMVEAPTRRVMVAESGIQAREDLLRLRAHGVHIALVGEGLMRQPDPGAALRALLSDPRDRATEA